MDKITLKSGMEITAVAETRNYSAVAETRMQETVHIPGSVG